MLDVQLLDARGFVHPFPLRIGVNSTDAERLPPGSVRRIERMEFRDRVEGEAQPMADPVIARAALAQFAA